MSTKPGRPTLTLNPNLSRHPNLNPALNLTRLLPRSSPRYDQGSASIRITIKSKSTNPIKIKITSKSRRLRWNSIMNWW